MSSDITGGMVVLFAPINVQCWKLGLVLTVWRSTAKSGFKPTALPIPVDVCKAFRVVELTEVANSPFGTYTAGADSRAMVVPIYRLGMVLRIQEDETKRGIDGIRVVLGEHEMKMVDAAKKWTLWNVGSDVRMKRKKASSAASSDKPVVVLVDDDDAKEPRSKKLKTKGDKVDNIDKSTTAVGVASRPPVPKMTMKILGFSIVRFAFVRF